MRKEFMMRSNEDLTEYMERGADYIRSIKQDKNCRDGRNLARELSCEEQKDVMQYVYGLAIEEMMKTSGRYAINRNNFGSYDDDFISNYAEVIMKRLDLFKDPERVTENSKSYRFPTFLNKLSGEAILKTYAQMHGVSPDVERRMYRVLAASRKVSAKKEKSVYEVTPAEIHVICDDITEDDIISILQYMNKLSLNQMEEEDNIEGDAFMGEDGIKSELLDILDIDAEKLLKGFFANLTDMEKLFVLIKVGCCDEQYEQMTAEELSVSPLVVGIAAADKKLQKNIAVGDIKITRPRRSSAEGNTSLELKGVEIVSYNLIRYHRKKAGDYLKSLEDKLQIPDLVGQCGVKFFIKQWNALVEKYM